MFIASIETANAETDVYVNGETTVCLWDVKDMEEIVDYFDSPALTSYAMTHSITVDYKVISADEIDTFMADNDISGVMSPSEFDVAWHQLSPLRGLVLSLLSQFNY